MFRPTKNIFFYIGSISLLAANLVAQSENQNGTKLTYLADTLEVVYHPLKRQINLSSAALLVGSESKELAATFEDPSRVLFRSPGVSLENDQNNSISFRGLTPEYIRWSIAGAEIVNPNHLSNAGRLSDESSASAGGVLSIPFDVIQGFRFYGNPYGAEQFSSMSGICNFDFSGQSDTFLKLGLLGMEAGIQTKGELATKAHARYSTVGLLSDMGVDFDGEKIKFYDLFARTEINPEWRLTVSAGRSTNFGSAAEESSEVESSEDLFDIDFKSSYLITGLEYKKNKESHALYYSRNDNSRTSTLVWPELVPDFQLGDRLFNQSSEAISYVNRYRWAGNSEVWELGSRIAYMNHRMVRQTNRFSGEDLNLVPYVLWTRQFKLGKWFLSLKPGLAAQYILNYDNKLRLEPSIHTDFSRGRHHVLFDFSNKYRRERFTEFESRGWQIPLTNRIVSYSLTYKWQYQPASITVMARAFQMKLWHAHYGVSQYLYRGAEFTEFINDRTIWTNTQQTVSKGIELSIDKNWASGFYMHLNYSLFDANNISVDLPSEHDFSYLVNAVFSKSYQFKNEKELQLNLAYHGRGGAVQYILESNGVTTEKLGDFNRIDLRIQFGNAKHLWVLDIQNLVGFKNDAYLIYDAYLDLQSIEKQLGTIPLLSYKRVF